jgi:hypothetical protein
MIKKSSILSSCILAVTFFLLFFSIFFTFPELHTVYGIELFSKDEKPFGISYDTWVANYWNWWIGTSIDEATPKQDGCLINKSESLVMLMETADTTSASQVCDISSTQGVLIPLWIGWADTAPIPGASPRDPNEPLSKSAREEANLGNIRSEVKVDGIPVAKLDVRMSLISGKLDYKINSLTNVTELYTADFDLTIPPDTHKPNQVPGKWFAGGHGWFVFLKPLPRGEHTISYSVRVTPTGALTSPGTNPHFADITYLLKVE